MLLSMILLMTLSFSSSSQLSIYSKSENFLNSLISPMKISIHVCWPRKTRDSLWKNLTNKYYVNILNDVKYSPNQLFIIDLDCQDSPKILKQAENLRLFQSSNKWLLIGDANKISDLYFGVDSRVFVIEPESNEISTLYKYSSKSDDFVRDYVANDSLPISKRRNLNGSDIRISVVVTNPDSMNHLWDYRDTHIDAITKYNYILSNNLMDYLNATRKFNFQPTWGYKNTTTGIYSGMVGDLQTNQADLGGTPLFWTVDRLEIIDYFAPTTPTSFKFIFRAPPLSYVTNVFTLPFASSVWHYSFVMVVVVVGFIYLIVKWEWKEKQFRKQLSKGSVEPLRDDFFEVVMMEIGAITQQGTNFEPKSVAGRIITIFTFLTLMFLYTSYSANIVALLQSTSNSIKTLEDLLHSRIKLGVEDIVYERYYFQNAKEPTKKAIYEQKVAPKDQKPNFLKPEDGISKVREGFFAYHVEQNTGYKIIGKTFLEGEKCGLKQIDYFNFIHPWLAMQKHSDYREIMRLGMRKMHESGIQTREFNRIYSRKPQCHTRGSNFGSVGIIDCYSGFLIFGISLGASLMLLVLEIIARHLEIIKKRKFWFQAQENSRFASFFR